MMTESQTYIHELNCVSCSLIPFKFINKQKYLKIPCCHHTRKDYYCYGYIKTCAFHVESEMVSYFVGVWLIKHRPIYIAYCGDTKFLLLSCWKYFTCSLHSRMKHFSTLKEKFYISVQPCNILYIAQVISPSMWS